MARHNRFCVLSALVLLPLSACAARQNAAGEPTPARTTTTTTTTTIPSPPLTETSPLNQENRCTAASLAGTIEPMDAAAGNRNVTLVVRNTSQQECTLWGYGGVELLSASKEPIPTTAERNLDPVPTLVRLKPGDEAGKLLHWNVIAAGDEPDTEECQEPAGAIRVQPPDDTATFEVVYEFGSVCAAGKLDTSAYFPQ